MIYVTQWFCPIRHLMFAVAWDEDAHTPEEMEADGERIFNSGQPDKRCGVCGSTEIHAEHTRTDWETIEQAAPILEAIEQRNMLAARIIRAQRDTRRN